MVETEDLRQETTTIGEDRYHQVTLGRLQGIDKTGRGDRRQTVITSHHDQQTYQLDQMSSLAVRQHQRLELEAVTLTHTSRPTHPQIQTTDHHETTTIGHGAAVAKTHIVILIGQVIETQMLPEEVETETGWLIGTLTCLEMRDLRREAITIVIVIAIVLAIREGLVVGVQSGTMRGVSGCRIGREIFIGGSGRRRSGWGSRTGLIVPDGTLR